MHDYILKFFLCNMPFVLYICKYYEMLTKMKKIVKKKKDVHEVIMTSGWCGSSELARTSIGGGSTSSTKTQCGNRKLLFSTGALLQLGSDHRNSNEAMNWPIL